MKKMSRVFSLSLGFVVCGIFVTSSKAAEKPKPDLSGNWLRDNKKSQIGEKTRDKLENIKITLKISYQEPELKINLTMNDHGKEVTRDMIYYTDERGEMNIPQFTQALTVGGDGPPTGPSTIPQKEEKSKTKWEGSKIVTSTSSVISAGGRTFHIDKREIRELSEDGKTLTIKHSISSPGGIVVLKEVYNRIP
jgi:hypothetical protein